MVAIEDVGSQVVSAIIVGIEEVLYRWVTVVIEHLWSEWLDNFGFKKHLWYDMQQACQVLDTIKLSQLNCIAWCAVIIPPGYNHFFEVKLIADGKNFSSRTNLIETNVDSNHSENPGMMVDRNNMEVKVEAIGVKPSLFSTISGTATSTC